MSSSYSKWSEVRAKGRAVDPRTPSEMTEAKALAKQPQAQVVIISTYEPGVVFPPRDLNALLDLRRFLEQHTMPALLLASDGRQIPLPEEICRLLTYVVEAMHEGKAVALVPHPQRLTLQEAADFLGVRRPTLVKLLEEGKIPFEQPGRHHRILLTDVLAYRDRLHEERRAALAEMTRDASEAGLYDHTAEDYAAALKQARKDLARERDSQ